ncbi:TonB-dependent receptor [hydrothermal vent metagenome]|uniref:TonB-dependent receptor n=1 Tax=hydrothermal vent metagenome TaxID=652676 RepID=A0A3B0T3D1_9ZZZZ
MSIVFPKQHDNKEHFPLFYKKALIHGCPYKMKNLFTILFLILIGLNANSQQSYVSGFVRDKTTGEALINAHIYDQLHKKGVITNAYGYFSYPAPKGSMLQITISFIGYERWIHSFQINSDTSMIVELQPGNKLQEVEVKASWNKKSAFEPSGKINFTGKQLEKVPGLLGEKDIIKTLQLMPGIQMGKEGSSRLYVRGGSPGQNLFLIDGVPVYNVNHLFGFFSVFTPGAVKSVEVYKGGFPARYGGRLSSIIDVRMKEGNLFEKKLDISIGTISSKITYESPIKKGKSSFIIATRRTYADAIFTPLMAIPYEGVNSKTTTWGGYYFYDLNAKLNFILSEKDRLYLSIYTGKDNLYMKEKEASLKSHSGIGSSVGQSENKSKYRNSWGNITTSARWNRIINQKLFANTTLSFSTYNYETLFQSRYSEELPRDNTINESTSYINYSGIKDIGLAIDFDYYALSWLHIKYGIKGSGHRYTPGKLDFKYESVPDQENDFTFNLHNTVEKIFELNGYIENHVSVSDLISVNLGVHALSFNSRGFNYLSIQPRILTNFQITNNFSLNAAMSKMCQPIHLLVNNGNTFPVDIWVPAVKELKPSTSDQVEIGVNYSNKTYELSVAMYWKKMDGIINYKNGESFFSLDEKWVDKLTQGEGSSYGAEILARKNEGKLTGWIGYTLSWAYSKFPDLNNGEAFPFIYDSRHQLSLVAMYKLNPKIELSASWVYNTGVPITISGTAYNGEDIYISSPIYGALEDFFNQKIYSPQSIAYYSGINQVRLPDYHRLDIGVDFIKQKKKGERIWSISVYNAYLRNNPFVLFTQVNTNGQVSVKNFSLFSFMPSISYRFKFNKF